MPHQVYSIMHERFEELPLGIFYGPFKKFSRTYPIPSFLCSSQCALKLEKIAISKVQKSIICIFKNGKKINFCTRKKFKTTKNPGFFQSMNCIFGNFKLFSGAKIDFLPFLKMQIMLFCTYEIALFFQF